MLSQLKKIMESNHVDVLLASSPDNVYYLSRFHALEPYRTAFSVVFPRDGEAVLLVPKPEEGFIPQNCTVRSRRSYDAKVSWELHSQTYTSSEPMSSGVVSEISTVLREMGLDNSRIGFEEKHMPYVLAEGLRQALPEARLEAGSRMFEEARMTKSQEEIERIRETVRTAEQALLEAFRSPYEGESELQFANDLRTCLLKREAEAVFVEMSVGTQLPSHPSEQKMRVGDIVHVDLGASYRGYSSDFCRNAVLMKKADEHVRINDVLQAAHQKVRAMIKPGLKASEIFDTAVTTIRSMGISNYNRHHVGHGVGISPHEPPLITATNERRLEVGMTLCFETPYRAPGIGSFNIENMVAVKEDGCEEISSIGEDLYVLPI